MTSSNPPYPNFNGITYNSSFFSTESQALTQGQANLLYLRKTIADTATAQEAFSAGIKTDSIVINSGVTGTILTIGNNDPVNIGFGNSRAGAVVNIGAGTGNVNIGNNLSSTVRLGTSGDGMNFSYDNMNLINSTGNYSIMSTQTSGNLSIGNNASRSGSISIGSSGNTGTIQILTGNTGNTNASPAISIGTDAGTKTIKINNNSNSVHCSSVDLAGSAINNITNTTGDLSIANLQTSGILNIGTGPRALTGSGGAINIGTGSAAIVNPINIGHTASATTIGNTLKFTGTASTTTINPSTALIDMNIAQNQTSSSLNIGSGVRTTGGYINIGNGSGSVANPIVIGGTGSAITLNGTTTISSLNIDAVQRGSNGTLLLGTTSTSTAINVARTGIATTVAGSLTVTQASTLTGLTTAAGGIKSNSYDINLLSPSELAFGAGVTTDVVRIADNITSGQILIGNGASCAGSCYIMNSGSSARTIGIGSASAASIINLYGTVTTTGISKLLCGSTTFSVGRSGDNAYWISSNNYVNGVYLAGASSAGWVNVSDITMKENITPMVNMLDKINELKPCQYNYIGNQDEICMGFIAQELQNQFPNLIYKSSDKLGIAYTGLIPVIIKAIQEQQEQINSLKDELKLLSAKIA